MGTKVENITPFPINLQKKVRVGATFGVPLPSNGQITIRIKHSQPMKTKSFFTTLMAALTLAILPCTTLYAEEKTDTVQAPASVPATKIQPTNGTVKGVTVNGRPATPMEKAVAKEMVKKGTKMAKKGAQMAVSAVTNPAKAEKISKELEAMGDEMERLGDSLEALAEDTMFLYDEADSLELSDSDFEELGEEIEQNFGWLNWWGRLFGGSLGILGGIFGVLIALLVVVLLFVLFTAPLWIIFLIVWLIVRNNRKPRTTAYVNPPLNDVTSQTVGSTGSAFTGDTATSTTAANTAQTAAPATGYVQPYPDENTEMWKSGVMTACIGVGLIILFITLGLEDLWGIGALVICIGVAKLVIAYTTKKKSTSNQASTGSYSNTPTPSNEDYSKNENA